MQIEEQKKVLGNFNSSFLSSLVGGDHGFFISLWGPFEKKIGNPALKYQSELLFNFYSFALFLQICLGKIIKSIKVPDFVQ